MESQVTVRIPEDLKRALDEASRKMQRKSSEIVRMALRAFPQPARAESRCRVAAIDFGQVASHNPPDDRGC